MSEWLFPDGITEADVEDSFGFTYVITDLVTSKAYVGLKQTRLKRGKKSVPSKWRDYYGSCEELLVDIRTHGRDRFERRILTLFYTAPDLRYGEVEEQIRRDVLRSTLPDGSRAYYNNAVAGRWFAHHFASRAAKAALAKTEPRP